MAELPASTFESLGDASAKAVIALVDQFLPRVGLPTYSQLADAKLLEVETVAREVAGVTLSAARAEALRLRVAHAVIAADLRAALVALERQDIFAVDSLLTQALGVAAPHAQPLPVPAILPPNVVPLAAFRRARHAADLGGL